MSAEWSEQPPAGGAAGNPGVKLAAQREAMGWTIEQVAEQLKLAPRQVLALEQGDFAALPNAAVVRGFVRAYAKVVKLDAAPLVAMIAQDVPETSNDSAARRDKPATFTAVRFPTANKRRLPLGALAVVGVLLVGAFGAYRFDLIPHHWMARADKAASVPASAVASAPAVALQPAAPAASASEGVAPPVSATTATPASAAASAPADTTVNPAVPLISVPPATVPASAPAAAATPAASAPVSAPAVATGNQLVLVVNQDSWVEIRRFKGAPLIKREVKAGNTETFDIADASFMIIGNPHGVTATLRGAPLELKPIPGGKISRVNFKSAP